MDSVYERVCKTLHFAAMAGFSSVSTAWDPFSPDDNTTATALKAMTLTLAFSRCILAMQYFIVMGFGWSKKQKTAVPLAIHGAVMVVSAVVYLGVSTHSLIFLWCIKIDLSSYFLTLARGTPQGLISLGTYDYFSLQDILKAFLFKTADMI